MSRENLARPGHDLNGFYGVADVAERSACVHLYTAAHGTRDSSEAFESAEEVVDAPFHETREAVSRAHVDRVAATFDASEPGFRQANNQPGDASVGHQQVGAVP